MGKSNTTEEQKRVWLAMGEAQSLVEMFGFIDHRASDCYASLARGAMERLTEAVDELLSCQTDRRGKGGDETKRDSAA